MTDGPARVVVVLGDIPATGHLGATAAVRAADLRAPAEAAPLFLDLVGRALAGSAEGVLVVYPEWQADAARRLIRLARGMLDTDRIAALGLRLPPLAFSLVADLLAYSAPYLQMGYLIGLGARLQREVLAGARLASVARLEHIETRLVHHVASYTPGAGFVAWAAPSQRVERFSGHVRPPEFRPPDPVHLIVTQSTDHPGFQEGLVSALRPQMVKVVPAQPLGPVFWGTRKHLEFVAFTGHPQALSHLVRSTPFWMCRWCRQPTSLDVCAICGMAQRAAQAPDGASAGAPTGPGPAARSRPAGPPPPATPGPPGRPGPAAPPDPVARPGPSSPPGNPPPGNGSGPRPPDTPMPGRERPSPGDGAGTSAGRPAVPPGISPGPGMTGESGRRSGHPSAGSAGTAVPPGAGVPPGSTPPGSPPPGPPAPEDPALRPEARETSVQQSRLGP